MTNFKITCNKCKIEAEIIEEDDGGCNDPECCGGRSEWVEAKCPKCEVQERIE